MLSNLKYSCNLYKQLYLRAIRYCQVYQSFLWPLGSAALQEVMKCSGRLLLQGLCTNKEWKIQGPDSGIEFCNVSYLALHRIFYWQRIFKVRLSGCRKFCVVVNRKGVTKNTVPWWKVYSNESWNVLNFHLWCVQLCKQTCVVTDFEIERIKRVRGHYTQIILEL